MRDVRRVAGVMLAGLLMACGGDEGSGPAGGTRPRGIQVIRGGNATDSAGTVLAAPVIVEVHDSTGALVPAGTLVRFRGLDVDGFLTPLVSALDSRNYTTLAVGNTDASGRTGADVQLGIRAGAQRLVVEVPTLGFADTVRFTAVPGSIALVQFAPRDTALYVGKSFTVRARVTDKYDNPRTDQATWTIVGTAASITSAGVVSSAAAGRAQLIGAVGARRDTIAVSVIPSGTLTAVSVFNGDIVTVELDGSQRSVRARANNGGIGVRPRWLPGTNDVIYSTYNGAIQELRVADATGATRPFLTSPPATLSHQAEAAPGKNGTYVYFGAYDQRCSGFAYCLFRARADGTAPEMLGNLTTLPSNRPSPSPEGLSVAFVTVDDEGTPVFRVMQADTRTVSAWSVRGNFPQWSPVAGTIAYLQPNGEVGLVEATGNGVRSLGAGGIYHDGGGFTWSPDGKWIAVARSGVVHLVHVATGEVLPVAQLSGLSEPSWR